MKSSLTNISTQFFRPIYQHNFSDLYTIKSTSECLSQIYQHNFPTYIRLNQQVSHKFINTIFLTYIRLNQQVTVSHKFINTIFSGLYTIKSTSNCLSKVFP